MEPGNSTLGGSGKGEAHLGDASLFPDSSNVEEIVTNGEVDIYPNVYRRTCIVVGVALSLFLIELDMTIVATAIPKITDEFSGIDLVGWYGSAFFITLASTQSIWGKVYQYFSLKYTFLLTIFIFELGSLISGLAPSSTVLIVGRGITGVGGAGIASGGYAILSVIVRPQLRPIFTGLITTTYSISSVIGPILGGIFAEETTWRWCFWTNLPLGGTSALVILLLFKTPKSARPPMISFKEKLSQMDLIGTSFVLGALICLMRGLQMAGINKSWTSSEVVGLLLGCTLLTSAFIVSQWLLNNRAMFVARLLKIRIVMIGMAYGFFHGGSFYLLLYYMPIYFQVVSGASPVEAGIRNLPLLVGCGSGSFLSGFLISRYGHFVPLMLWASAGGCIGAGLIFTLDANSPSRNGLVIKLLRASHLAQAFHLPSFQAKLQPYLRIYRLLRQCYFVTAENIGTVTAIAAGQSLLSNLLLSRLTSTAHDIDPLSVIRAGATEIRTLFPPDAVPGIVDSYLYGLHAVYAIVIAYAGVAVFVAAASERKSLKSAS